MNRVHIVHWYRMEPKMNSKKIKYNLCRGKESDLVSEILVLSFSCAMY